MFKDACCELIKDADSGKFRVEICETDTGERLFTGALASTPAKARLAALRGLHGVFNNGYMAIWKKIFIEATS